LDAAHSDLLAFLLSGDVTDRQAFEARARGLRLLTEGALETINDWGFDTFDEAVLDCDDQIVPVSHLRGRILQMVAVP